jgi:hypothetical protein
MKRIIYKRELSLINTKIEINIFTIETEGECIEIC